MSDARGTPLFKVQGLRAGFDGTTVLSVDASSFFLVRSTTTRNRQE